MELSPHQYAQKLFDKYKRILTENRLAKLSAMEDVAGKIELLSDLNQTKMCKFEKEIDFYDAVLKSLTKL